MISFLFQRFWALLETYTMMCTYSFCWWTVSGVAEFQDFHLNLGLFEVLIYWKVWASLTARGVLLSSYYKDS